MGGMFGLYRIYLASTGLVPVLEFASPLQPGQTIVAADVQTVDIPVAARHGDAFTAASQAVGQTMAVAALPGSQVRAGDLAATGNPSLAALDAYHNPAMRLVHVPLATGDGIGLLAAGTHADLLVAANLPGGKGSAGGPAVVAFQHVPIVAVSQATSGGGAGGASSGGQVTVALPLLKAAYLVYLIQSAGGKVVAVLDPGHSQKQPVAPVTPATPVGQF